MAAPTELTRAAALAMLGLTAQASAREATQAYRRLAKATHPDVAGPRDHDAARRFAALTEAYHVLTLTPAPPRQPGPPPLRRPLRVRVRFTQQPPLVAGPVRVTPPDPSPTVRRPA
jgi:DnaJ-like protein